MTKRGAALLFLLSVITLSACSGGGSNEGGGGSAGGDRTLQGGDTTSPDRTTLAFENPATNLSDIELARHLDGDAAFGDTFVTPPATFNAGLGPLFNNSSCEGCHTKNGRGQPLFGVGSVNSQAVLKISIPNGNPEVPGAPGAVPGYGTQFQDHATFGIQREGIIQLQWESLSGSYGDGTPYSLRRPKIDVREEKGRLPSNLQTSIRTPPPIFGLGLLEAVPTDQILALADPSDANGDGISGRPNMVWDIIKQAREIGRFGRKGSRPSLLQQAASAYAEDMGVRNDLFPSDDQSVEVDGNTLTAAEFYTQTIAVPAAARVNDPRIRQGESLFRQFGCASCHAGPFRTGPHAVDALANQTIFPYTDLLLHDMGEGLADGRPDFEADGREWRTTPLWGIGVTATILSSTANYLHDGRARTLDEAILWHGGEAEGAKEQFRNAPADSRSALLEFLRSL